MRALLRLYSKITTALGVRRRFLRRLGGICLILLGVHAAADVIDDLVYQGVDAVDLAIDSALWWVFDGMASLGTIAEQTAVSWGQDVASWLEVEEKDKIALALAFLVELLVDALLIDFAWGRRKAALAPDDEPVTLVAELKESARELKEAFWPLDLERLAVIPTVFAFACAGTFLAGLAVESVVGSALGSVAPLWTWGVNLAAAAGLLASALLLWRLLPDMLHGAILRAHQRGRKFARATAYDPEQSSTVEIWRRRVRRLRRGAFMLVVLLPIAVVSLASQTAMLGLVARIGAIL